MENQNEITIETKELSGLFQGDCGHLPLETRRVLVLLLSGPFMDARRNSQLWPVLLRDEKTVREYLSEIFLELILDADAQVAFTRQADTGALDTPSLLRRQNLTYIESVMLLFLRQRLAQADARAERAVVSWDEIREALQVYEKTQSTDRAGYEKRLLAALNKIKQANILQKIRAAEDRYEVSPTLKLLFSPEEIQNLTSLYELLAAGKVIETAEILDDEGVLE